MNALATASADALALLFPVVCIGCSAHDRDCCGICADRLRDAPRHIRLVAGVRCDAPFEYDGLARRVVLGFKVHGRTGLARVLGPPFARAVLEAVRASGDDVAVVLVPASRRGRMRRGFDPVLLALRAGGVRRLRARRLRRVRRRDQNVIAASGSGQKGRSAVERVAATVGTLRAPATVAGRRVVIVDDVVTTGTTMAEAVRAVRAAGGTVTRCVAIAGVEQ